MISLLEAPQDKPLRIVAIQGPEGARRRLLSLGLRTGIMVELSSQAPFGGPVLVKDKEKEMCFALGRGIARRIQVDIVDGRK